MMFTKYDTFLTLQGARTATMMRVSGLYSLHMVRGLGLTVMVAVDSYRLPLKHLIILFVNLTQVLLLRLRTTRLRHLHYDSLFGGSITFGIGMNSLA